MVHRSKWGRDDEWAESSIAPGRGPNLESGFPSSRMPVSGTRTIDRSSLIGGPTSLRSPSRETARPLILFAEDSARATFKMTQLLMGAGYDVMSASNGVSALRLAREHAPTLILLDVDMPEMLGTEACALLKADPKTRTIPVVLFIERDDASQLCKGFKAGCDGYIFRGTSDTDILRKLEIKLLPGTSLQL